MIPILYWSNISSLTTGGQKSLSYILRDIDRKKYLPVLACQSEGALTAKAREYGISVELIKLPPAMRPWHIFKIVKFIEQLSGILDKYGIKIVHSEELTVVFMTYFIKLFKNIKTIWHVRVLWDTPWQKRIGLFICDAVICVSQPVSDSFKSDSNKLNVINNGIDPDEFKPGSPKAVSDLFKENDILIGQVGTLVEHKRQRVLLLAAPLVLKNYPSVKFLIIGSGKDKYTLYLKSLAIKLGIENNVIFWGEEANIQPLMNRLDIVCLLSQNEGLSRVLLEAMCMEKTIITSDIPQNKALIIHDNTGLNAKLDSPEDTAFQINRILADRQIALNLGKTAREYVIHNYSLKSTITLIQQLYVKLGY